MWKLNEINMIELEFRAMFSKDKYDSVKTFLDAKAENLGQDDKSSVYFVFPDRLLKIVHNISNKDAKISLKLNYIGGGAAFEELEFLFAEKDLEIAKQIFKNLPLNAKILEESQARVNYQYKDCEIALKYGKTWGYHLEIEKMIQDISEQPAAEKEIRAVAKEIGVELMTEEELEAFTGKVIASAN